MKQAEASAQKEMGIHVQQFSGMAQSIWRIFPAFCLYPRDLAETFPQIAESIAF